MKMNKIMISTITGKLLRIVDTSELIPGMELIALNGLRILMTRIADMSDCAKARLIHPKTTTKKSSYINEIG